jgi:cation diffusion facilitator family transporter
MATLGDDAQAALQTEVCRVREAAPLQRGERGIIAVVALTAVMMVVEIVAGYATHSMALTADGWHMATHVGALGMSAAAYAFARRFAEHRAFVFGTGKVQALAGFTSALLLGVVALSMAYESVRRLLDPFAVDYATSLPVAVVGLLVNLVSVRLLHGDHDSAHAHHHAPQPEPLRRAHSGEHTHSEHTHSEHTHSEHAHSEHAHSEHAHSEHEARREPSHHHEHGPTHDHNHRAALMHVVADALTSALAIVALLAGRSFGITWLDPVTGIVGGIVILKWSYELCRHSGQELLDVEPTSDSEQRIRAALAEHGDVQITDLHVWSVGAGRRCGVVTLAALQPHSAEVYRAQILGACKLSHLTVEVRRAAQK